MFTAVVLACLLSQPDMCIEATDSRGPYPTKLDCTNRTEEMIVAMISLLPPVPHQFKYKCVLEGSAT